MMLGPVGTRMRGIVPTLMGIARLGGAAGVMMRLTNHVMRLGGAASGMMRLTNHVMRLRSVRLLHRFTKLGVPETLLTAAVALNLETDMGESISHAERVLGAR